MEPGVNRPAFSGSRLVSVLGPVQYAPCNQEYRPSVRVSRQQQYGQSVRVSRRQTSRRCSTKTGVWSLPTSHLPKRWIRYGPSSQRLTGPDLAAHAARPTPLPWSINSTANSGPGPTKPHPKLAPRNHCQAKTVCVPSDGPRVQNFNEHMWGFSTSAINRAKDPHPHRPAHRHELPGHPRTRRVILETHTRAPSLGSAKFGRVLSAAQLTLGIFGPKEHDAVSRVLGPKLGCRHVLWVASRPPWYTWSPLARVSARK